VATNGGSPRGRSITWNYLRCHTFYNHFVLATLFSIRLEKLSLMSIATGKNLGLVSGKKFLKLACDIRVLKAS
jgi:hypothetical protein